MIEKTLYRLSSRLVSTSPFVLINFVDEIWILLVKLDFFGCLSTEAPEPLLKKSSKGSLGRGSIRNLSHFIDYNLIICERTQNLGSLHRFRSYFCFSACVNMNWLYQKLIKGTWQNFIKNTDLVSLQIFDHQV